MKALTTFILRGPSQAMLVVVGTAVLAMMLPPLSVLSGAAVALVTLRNGVRSGAIVMLGSAAFVALLAWLSLGNALLGAVFLVVLWLPPWVLGWVLREMRSLALATMVAGMLGIIGVLVVYAIVGDVTTWWQQILLAIFEPVMEADGSLLGRAEIEANLANLASGMTGIVAAGVSLNVLLCLYLARAWQAQLYNPGGFRSEFHTLGLGQGSALVSLGFIALSLLPLGVVSQMAGEIVTVIFVLYVIQGLALLHSIVAQRELHVAWLVVFYPIMLFVVPQLLAVMGLIDVWADFRRRFAAK